MVNVEPGLYNLKSKVDDLDADKLKTAPVNLKQLSDVVSKNVVKNTNLNKLNMKINNLGNKIPDASTLIQTNNATQIKKNCGKKLATLTKNT